MSEQEKTQAQIDAEVAKMRQPSSRHRSYSTGAVDPNLEPVTFEIDGVVFECKAWVPGALITEYATYMTSDRIELEAMALLSLYNHVMDEAEAARFHRFIYDPDRRVDIQVLGEIMAGLMEEYTARPLLRPVRSGNGQPAAGDSSTAAASSQG